MSASHTRQLHTNLVEDLNRGIFAGNQMSRRPAIIELWDTRWMIPNVTAEYVGQILIVPILLCQIDTSTSREYNTCEICGGKHEVFSSRYIIPKLHTDTTQVPTTEVVASINYQHCTYTKGMTDTNIILPMLIDLYWKERPQVSIVRPKMTLKTDPETQHLVLTNNKMYMRSIRCILE